MKVSILAILAALIWTGLSAQSLNRPESVAFDPQTGYFYVSNTGNGSIIRTKDLETYSYFTQGKGAVRGLIVSGRRLYAASDKGLLVFDLDRDALLKTHPVAGSTFLNDVAADADGNAYITDSKAHKVFKYDSRQGAVSPFVESGIQSPNGILYDAANKRLLLVSLRPNSPIQAISLPEGNVSTFKSTSNGNLDGLGMDKAGNLYFSSWQTSSIYRLKDAKSSPVKVLGGLSGPADFFVFEYGGGVHLLIPQLTGSSLRVAEIKP